MCCPYPAIDLSVPAEPAFLSFMPKIRRTVVPVNKNPSGRPGGGVSMKSVVPAAIYAYAIRMDLSGNRQEADGRRAGASRAKLTKDEFRALLRDRNTAGINAWARSVRGPLRLLTSLLFDVEPIVFWRAIEAMGRTAAVIAQKDPERVRLQIRNLLWLMNDESGGLCRRAPEALGEILINVPVLLPDYVHLLPRFLWAEPFERGIRFAMYRVATMRPETRPVFSSCLGDLIKSLDNFSESIRGYSLLALKPLRRQLDESGLALPDVPPATIPVYNFETGELRQMTIGISDLLDEQTSLF